MTYRDGHPVRPVGGRLALDFLNTADWASGGTVVHEKIAELADFDVWLRAVGLPETVRPGSVEAIHSFRRDLRRVFRAEADARLSVLQELLGAIDLGETTSLDDLACQPALGRSSAIRASEAGSRHAPASIAAGCSSMKRRTAGANGA